MRPTIYKLFTVHNILSLMVHTQYPYLHICCSAIYQNTWFYKSLVRLICLVKLLFWSCSL